MSLRRSLIPGIALGLLFTYAETANAETVEVTARALNCRTGPSTRNRVIKVLRRGQRYGVVRRSGSWAQLQLGGGVAGWSYARGYLKTVSTTPTTPPPPTTGRKEYVTVGRLNVRTGPSTRYRLLGSVTRGTELTITGAQGSWKRTVYRGRTAWVYGPYVGPRGTTPPGGDGRRRSRAGFIQLKASGPGFTTYQAGYRRWGKPALIYGLERAGRQWAQRGRRPRMRFGDISRENGGRFSPHVSHRVGEDVDMGPMRNDGREAPTVVGYRSYSRPLTHEMIRLLMANIRVELILFNDSRIPETRYYRGHANHLHLRMR